MARILTVTFILLCIYCCYTYGAQRRYFSIIKYRKNLNRNAVKHSRIYRPHINRLGKWGRRQLIGSWRNLNDSVIEKKLDHMYRKLKDKVNYNVTLKTNGTHFNLGFTENSHLENKHVVGIKDGFLNVNSTLRKDGGDARHEIHRIIGKEERNPLTGDLAKEETTKSKEDESAKEKEKDFPQVSWTLRKEDNATESSEKQREHANHDSTAQQNSVSNQSKEKQIKDAATKSGKKTSEQFNKIVKAKDANLFDTQDSNAPEKLKDSSTPKKKEAFNKETDNGSADDQNEADSSALRNDDDSDDATASMSPPREMDSTTLNSEMDVEVGNVDDSPETSNRDHTPSNDLTYDDGGSGKPPHEEAHKSKSGKDQSASSNMPSNQNNEQKHIKDTTSGLNHKQFSNHKVKKMHDDKTNSSPYKINQGDENDNGSANEEENTDASNQSNSDLPIYQSTSKANNDAMKETDGKNSNTKETKNSNKNKNTNNFNGEANNAEAVGEESKIIENETATETSHQNSNSVVENTEKTAESSQDSSKSRAESQNEQAKLKNEEGKSQNEKTDKASENVGTENKNAVTENSSKNENKQEMTSNKDGATSNTNTELSSEDSKINKNAESSTKENSASNSNANKDHDQPENSADAKNNKENTNNSIENKMEKSVNEVKSEKGTEPKDGSNTQIENKSIEQKENSNNDIQTKNDALKNAEKVLSSYESATANTGEMETDEDLYKEPDDQRELNAKETKNGEIKLTGGYDPDEPEGSSVIKDVSSTNKISYANNGKNDANIIDDVGNALQNTITTSNGGSQLSFGKDHATNDKSESTENQKKKEEDVTSNDMKLESKDFSKEKKAEEKEEAVKPEDLHANPAPQSRIEEQFKEIDKMKKMNQKEIQNTNEKAPEKSDSFAETKEAANEKTARTDPEDIHANPAPTSSVEEQFRQMEKTKEEPTKEEKKEEEKTENTGPEDLHKNPGPTSTVEEQFKEMASKAPSATDEKNVNLAADESASSTASKDSKESKEAVNENTDKNEGPETLHQNPAPTSKVEEQFKELEKQAKEKKEQDKKMKMKKGKESAKDVEISFLEASQESSEKQDAPKEDSKETKTEEKTEPEDLHKNPTPPGKNLQSAKDSIFRFRQHKGAEIHTDNDEEGGSATIDDVMNAIEHKNTSQLLEMGSKTHAHNTLVNPAPFKNNTKMVVKDDDGETAQNGDLMDYNLDHNSVTPQLTVKVASGTGSSSKTTNFHEVGLRAKDDPDDGSNVVSPTHPKKEPVSSKIKNKAKGEKVEEKSPEIPNLIDMDQLEESLCTVAKKLTVKFRHPNGTLLTIYCGENYNYTSAFDHPPMLTLDRANVNGIYTLLFVDADAPSPLYPIARCTVHWMIVNIMDADLDTGTTIVPYRKPNPQTTTGPHRFAFLLLKQKSLEPRAAFDINVCRLDINKFAFHHNITYIEGFKYFSTQSNIDYLVLTQPQVKSVATKS